MTHSFLLIFSDFQMDGLCFPRNICYHSNPPITNLHLLIFGINNHFSF